MAENRVIGQHGQLPWHLPDDLKHFKKLTLGKPVIMGRKTFESIGRPLPDRHCIVVSRNTQYVASGCTVVPSPEAALQAANADEICLIGGATLYTALLPRTNRIELTEVHADFAGDAFFPVLNSGVFQETARIFHAADEKHAVAFSFVTLERVQ